MISEKLQELNQVKQNIKQALIDKEVDMTDVPFTEYANKISEFSGGIDLSKTNMLNNVADETASVTINSKVLCISGSSNVYDSGTAKLTIVVDGSTITCNETNGTYVYKRSGVNSAGKRCTGLLWINNGIYKDKVITSASHKGARSDGDSVIIVTTIE